MIHSGFSSQGLCLTDSSGGSISVPSGSSCFSLRGWRRAETALRAFASGRRCDRNVQTVQHAITNNVKGRVIAQKTQNCLETTSSEPSGLAVKNGDMLKIDLICQSIEPEHRQCKVIPLLPWLAERSWSEAQRSSLRNCRV
jgi:hypothetical protein